MTLEERLIEALPFFIKYQSPISIATRMAQYAVESQAGNSDLFRKSNNGFGIKATAPWTGDVLPHVSPEVGGARSSEFRKYPSLEASIKDHAGFFESTEFRKSDAAYGLAIKATNYKDEARNLGPKFPGDKNSYAGDPLYADKLIEVIERYNLTQYNVTKEDNNMSHPFYKEDIVALALKTKLRPLIQQITKVNMGGVNNPEWIVIHFVGAEGQAKANADYFEYVYREASAQIFEDKNYSYQVVPNNRVAWHIGDGAYAGRGGSANGYKIAGKATNSNSVGIEGCQDTSTGSNVWAWQFHVNTYVMMLLRTIDLQKKYGIPDSKVIRHFDASQKSCPGNWMANDWARWKQFKKDLVAIKKAMAGGVVDVTPAPKPTPTPTGGDGKLPLSNMYTIKVGDTLGKIAREHKVTVKELVAWNGIKNANVIYPETKIFIKSPDTSKPVTPVTTITQNGKPVPKTGGFKFSEEVNIRNQAGAWGSIPDRYYPGETLNKYDSVTLAGGHIWLGYKSHDGKQRYVSAGTPNVSYGKFV